MSPRTVSPYHEPPDTSTSLFAPEIETALIAIAWRQPDRLATVKRELDPSAHFLQPHLRWILEAIDLAYRELNDVSFGPTPHCCVIQILRELGRLENCGGIEGVNEVYRAGEFLDSPVWQVTGKTDALFAEYLALLKVYALNRKANPPQPTYWFNAGKATLVLNKVKRSENDPDFIGEARICGRSYTVGASLAADGSFLNFRFEPKK